MPHTATTLSCGFARSVACCLFLLTLVAPQARAAALSGSYPVAMRSFGVWETATGERFDFSVWYPGNAPQGGVVREGWLVEANRRGRVIPGFYPLVLLSHDAVSGRFANNDMAASLASGGRIVVVPTHMGDNQNDSKDFYTARALRGRPRHLLRALETVLDSPDFAPYADESRIGLIGVGFGSVTVLQLAGAVPDASGLERHCGENGAPPAPVVRDAFCGPWIEKRLASLADGMRRIRGEEGENTFTPSLDIYAPALVPAPASPAVAEARKPVEQKADDFSLRRFFFGEDAGEEEQVEPLEQPASALARQGNSTGTPGTAGAGSGATHSALDFQGGIFFGGTDSGEAFVHIALPDSPQFRAAITQETGAVASPANLPPRPPASSAHRRPAQLRRILGIALVAPAGGSLFSREALAGINVPVAILEAGDDALYPPRRHSQPFYTTLPVPPEILSFAGADHYSLFAQCPKDTMTNLGEACGRLVGQERETLAEKRDRFLASFFHAVLGEPQAPAAPSGFVAMPRGLP